MLENVFDLRIDVESAAYLKETAKWARFFSILGFIFCGLLLIFALVLPRIITQNPEMFQAQSQIGIQGMEVGLIFGGIIAIAIYLYPCILLFRFSGKLLQSLKTNDQLALNLALKNQRTYCRYIGILTIIVLGLYAIFFIIAMIGFAFTRR